MAKSAPAIIVGLMRGALVAEAMSDDELPAEQPLEDVVTEENEQQPKKEQKTITTKKVGRNDKCPCGSGKKYKHCHGSI